MSRVENQGYGTGQLPALPAKGQLAAKAVTGGEIGALEQVVPVSGPEALQPKVAQYASAGLPAASLSFCGSADLIKQGLADFDALSATEREQLTLLAAGLGFANARTLSHALRHLPQDALAPWLASLPPKGADLGPAAAGLASLARTRIETLAKAQELPLPRFEGDQSRWDAASFLGVYNSLTEMKAGLPEPLFKKLASANGAGLVFAREGQPVVGSEATLMNVLSGCMCIAETNGVERITLYDPALSMDPASILGRDEVKNFLAGLHRPEPDPEAVRSLVEMLNLALPPARRLDPAAGLGPPVYAALADFETLETLKQALDIVSDDSKLAPGIKKQRQQEIKALIRDLRAGSLGDAAAPERLLSALAKPGLLSGSGSERLEALRQSFSGGVCSRTLQPRQLELLVRNWFGILDSGNRLDFAEQVINHELGHLFHAQDDLIADWSQISFKDFDQTPNLGFMGETLRPDKDSGFGFSGGFGSDYARVNPEEDFAESFRLFTREPGRLAAANPLKFVFLAGASGAWEGREAELVQLLRDQGCSAQKLRQLTLALRGQSATAAAQKAHDLLGAVDRLAAFFHLETDLAGTGAAITAKLTARFSPSFQLRAATMLPGLEQALGMPSQAQSAVHPSQPGYLLDWLKEQQRQLADPDQAVATAARQALDRFATQGLSAFDAETRALLPATVKTRCEKPEARAVMLVLAQIQADPARIGSWSQGLQKVGEALDAQGKNGNSRLDPRQRLSAARLEQLLGKELVASLPPSFRSLLREPGMLERMSGYFGQIQLDSGLLLADIDSRLARQAEALQAAMRTLREASGNELLNYLAVSGIKREGEQFVVAKRPSGGVFENLRELYQGLREGLGLELDYSEAEGRALLEAICARLNQQKLAPEDLEADSSRYREHLRDMLREEMLQRQPELRLVLEERLNT